MLARRFSEHLAQLVPFQGGSFHGLHYRNATLFFSPPLLRSFWDSVNGALVISIFQGFLEFWDSSWEDTGDTYLKLHLKHCI